MTKEEYNNSLKGIDASIDGYDPSDETSYYIDQIRVKDEYIASLEAELAKAKKSKKKKTRYTVVHLLVHDLSTEDRRVYHGTDVNEARKAFVDYLAWVDDYSKEYFSPFDELNEDETGHYIEYTGLQIRQQMVDRFNKAIEDKETEVTVECGKVSNDCVGPETVTLYIDYDD